MSAGDFSFLPRKILRPADKSTPEVKNAVEFIVTSASRIEPVDARLEATSDVEDEKKSSPKGKQPAKEKYLDDSAYLALLELALSDHAVWTNAQLVEAMESDTDGFVPLSYVTHGSPAFVELEPFPPESLLVRCAKGSSHLEGRMMVSNPKNWKWTSGGGSGGFEVRRKDWTKLREKMRRYTSFQWECKTIYVENLPHYARTMASVYSFVKKLLPNEAEENPGMVSIQSIKFPPHRDDHPGAPPPTKSKGFAFILLAQTRHMDYLLQRWPWEVDERLKVSYTNFDDEQLIAIEDARDFGFRCLSKKRWDLMKEEYLALQERLLDETINASKKPRLAPMQKFNSSSTDAPSRASPAPGRDDSATSRTFATPSHSRIYSEANYPTGCLIFVKHVNPETNKTTLRTLFSSALGTEGSAIDYVDYNKGLDSCYLRLSNSTHADAIRNHFAGGKVVQDGALDNSGQPSASHPKLQPLEVELVAGKKEEMYWDKVPAKIRMQALEKTRSLLSSEDTGTSQNNASEGRTKQKRRKHG